MVFQVVPLPGNISHLARQNATNLIYGAKTYIGYIVILLKDFKMFFLHGMSIDCSVLNAKSNIVKSGVYFRVQFIGEAFYEVILGHFVFVKRC